MFCYNTLTNLAEVNGLLFLKNLLQELDTLVKETNQQLVRSEVKLDVEPLIALLEHVYSIIQDIENSQIHSSMRITKESHAVDIQNAKTIVIEFITELVLDKGGIIISDNLFTILFANCEDNPHLQTRILYIIMKSHVLEDNKMEVKDLMAKSIRNLLAEQSRMLKEIQDKEQELRILSEEFSEIVREEEEAELENSGIKLPGTNEDEEVVSIMNSEDNLNEEQNKEEPVEESKQEIINIVQQPGENTKDIPPMSNINNNPNNLEAIPATGVASAANIPLIKSRKQQTKSSAVIITHSNTETEVANVAVPDVLANMNKQSSILLLKQQTSIPQASLQSQFSYQSQQSQNLQNQNIPRTMSGASMTVSENNAAGQQSSKAINSSINKMRRKSTQSSSSKTVINKQARKKKIAVRIQQLHSELDRIGVTPLNLPVIWKFLERPIRNYEGIQSLSNAFFWEFFNQQLTEYQHILLNFMFGLMILLNKTKTDSIWRNLILQSHDQFLKVVDLEYVGVYRQLGFIFVRYMSEVMLQIFQNKGKKSDVIKSEKFSLFRKVLIGSKIRELVDISKQLEACIKNK